MKRSIIKIDENRCIRCGFCVTGCYEQALAIVDNRVVIKDERLCDGLGACIRYCGESALSLEIREAAPYYEERVLHQLIPQGEQALRDHFKQLLEANDYDHVNEGLTYLKKHNISFDWEGEPVPPKPVSPSGETDSPPPSAERPPIPPDRPFGAVDGESLPYQPSELMHFPIQLSFFNPEAGYLRQSHMLLAGDCTAFACGDFHARFLKGKNLGVACPKLDTIQEVYIRKIVELMDDSMIKSLTLLIMDLPCCEELVEMVRKARKKARRYLPLRVITLTLKGVPKSEQWV